MTINGHELERLRFRYDWNSKGYVPPSNASNDVMTWLSFKERLPDIEARWIATHALIDMPRCIAEIERKNQALSELIAFVEQVEDRACSDGEGHIDTMQSEKLYQAIRKAKESLFPIQS